MQEDKIQLTACPVQHLHQDGNVIRQRQEFIVS